MTNVTPFTKNGRYTDIRTAIRDIQEKFPNAKQGIIILFDGDEMQRLVVCKSSQISYAACDLMVFSTTHEDEID